MTTKDGRDHGECLRCGTHFSFLHPKSINDGHPPCPRCGSLYWKWLNAEEYVK